MLIWHWTPGAGGLLALVPPQTPVGDGQGVVVPAGMHPVRPLHLTFLRSQSMVPLIDVLDPTRILPTLPPLRLPRFEPCSYIARRGPHPIKDPPDSNTDRLTGFLAATPEGQAFCRTVLNRVVKRLDRASREQGGPGFAHPEPTRFFHLSIWNNRDGDSMRSIGDIGPEDCHGS